MSGEQDSSEFTESMAKDIDDILNDSMFTGRTERQNETTPGMYLLMYTRKRKKKHRNLIFFSVGTVNEGASTISTTPDPLNTAFINVNISSHRHRQYDNFTIEIIDGRGN